MRNFVRYRDIADSGKPDRPADYGFVAWTRTEALKPSFDAPSSREPVSTPDQVRGRLSLENAIVSRNPRFSCYHRFTLTPHFVRRVPFQHGEAGYGSPSFPGGIPCWTDAKTRATRLSMAASLRSTSAVRSSECVVRNISETGAHLEFSNVVKRPKEKMSLTIARKGRSFLAKVVWWRDNFVGVAFSSEQPYELAGLRSRGAAAQEREEKAPAAAPHQGTDRRRLTA